MVRRSERQWLQARHCSKNLGQSTIEHHLDLRLCWAGADGEGGKAVVSEGLAICASLVSLLLHKLTVEKLCGTA